MARPAFLTVGVGQAAGLATTTAALAVLPFCLDDYILHWTITVLMFVVIALAWDLFGALRTIIVRTYRVLRPRGLRLCPVVHRLASASDRGDLLASVGVGAVAAVCGKLFLRVRGIYFRHPDPGAGRGLQGARNPASRRDQRRDGPDGAAAVGGNIVPSYFFVLVAAFASATAWRCCGARS